MAPPSWRASWLLQLAQPRRVTLRTAWVCSPIGGNFVKTMLRFGEERPEMRVVADQHGAPTFAADLAAAAVALLPRLAAAPAGDPVFGVTHFPARASPPGTASPQAIFAARRAARPAGAEAHRHRHRRLPDAGPPARQFPARLQPRRDGARHRRRPTGGRGWNAASTN